jgi:hypothetical protein
MADDRFPIDDDYIPPLDQDDDGTDDDPIHGRQGDNNERKAMPSRRKRRHPMLYGWLAWIVFAAAVTAVMFPKVQASIIQSGAIDLISDHRQRTASGTNVADSRTVYPYFVIPISKATHEGATLSYQAFAAKQRKTGQGVYHDTIEALLDGPGQEALRHGAISLVAPGTSLRGLSESNGTIYVDFSGPLLDSATIWPAFGMTPAVQQIRRSLLALDGIRHVVIMLDGEITSL